jgi:hypothetical protein
VEKSNTRFSLPDDALGDGRRTRFAFVSFRPMSLEINVEVLSALLDLGSLL